MGDLARLLAGCEDDPGVLADYIEEHHGLPGVTALLRLAGPPPTRPPTTRQRSLDDAGLTADVFLWLAQDQHGVEIGLYAHPEKGPWATVRYWRRAGAPDHQHAVEAARAEVRALPAP